MNFDFGTLFGIFCLLLIIVAAVLLILYMNKVEEIKQMKAAHQKLMRSFNDLDEQAKLIVKTDLELNKAQEELEKRLQGLNTLQKFSKDISKTLDEKEVLQRVNAQMLTEIGFSRGLIMNYDDQKKLRPRVNISMPDDRLTHIMNQLDRDDHFKTALKEGHTFSSINCSKQTKEKIVQLFGMEHFILTPIPMQNDMGGMLFVGNRYSAPAVTEGDEELISIFANQIGQSLDNAQLFEQVFRSTQMLESKVKERTKELESALEKVKLISKQKSEFISSVSHELRTPLTSIKGYASILIAGKIGEVPTAVKERLAKINTHSDSLVKMINDLLDIARIESGRADMKYSLQPVKPVIDNIADLLTPQMTTRELNLKVDLPPDIPDIYIDRNHVERVFINLVGNALKFTPAKGSITIAASPELDDGMVVFSISDTGIGIKEDDLAKLFEEFYRVDNEINAGVKGTGLGLSLVKQIVEAHAGRIWVTSQVGQGTTFHFTMPTSEEQVKTAKKEIKA
jgi:signal transduction histidine kinase